MIIHSADQGILEFASCISVLCSHQMTKKTCTFDAFEPFWLNEWNIIKRNPHLFWLPGGTDASPTGHFIWYTLIGPG